MQASEIFTNCYLRSQSIKLFCRRLRRLLYGLELLLANHMLDFNARHRTPCCPERFEAEHRSHHPLYRSMVLLDKIIKILRLSDDDGGLVSAVIMCDRCRVTATLINRDLLREPMSTHRLVQKGRGSSFIAVRG